MSRIRVQVTHDDINAGDTFSGARCPVALALHRLGFPRAYVGRGYWEPDRADGLSWPLTKACLRWTERFDYGEPVKPATFVIEGPP